MKDTFLFRNHLCIVFEMLSANLYELIKQNQFRGLSMSLVRIFVKQILECLVLLSRAKIIHSDLKPENILLKTLTEPEIKVIDFGSACHENQTIYTYIQSRFYRSPEVLVGLPYTSSIDMWSLGCIAAELYLGLPLFPGTSEYNQVSRIVDVLGMPQQWMCEKGKTSKNFFGKKVGGGYELKTMEAYMRDTGLVEQPSKRYFAGNTLEEIINVYPMPKKEMSSSETEKEIANRKCLLDFLGGLLKLNPLERWSPQQAKMHPFVTGEPFLAPFATSATFRLQPSVFQLSSPTAPSAPIGLPLPPNITPTGAMHGGDSPESITSSSTAHAATVSTNSNVGAGSNSNAATRRPRANTMIQAVPPQLQKIVTMQQQSGPNKSSLRNAAAGGGGAFIIMGGIPGNAKSTSAVVAAAANSSLNNDDVVYPSPDMKPVAAESTFIPHAQLDEDTTSGANGRARSFSISQDPSVSYDPHYQRHYPLRKAVSETLNSPLQPSSQFHQNQHQQQHNVPPLPNQAHHYHHQNQHHGSMPITESLNSLQLSSHGGFQQQQIPYYDGSHVPYEVLSNLNPGALVDPAQMGFQQHPRMGEKGERKSGLASRVPSLPGLVELDPTGNPVDPAVAAAAAALAHAARTNSNPDLGPGSYDMNQRRMSSTTDGYGNASPRFRTQPGFAFPNQNAYTSSPRSSFPSSPRSSHQQPQHSPYSQQPVPPVYSSSPYQYPAQSGLGVYDPSGSSSYANETPSQHAGPGFRGRSVSLSMYGQYPLNQPWNQPLPPAQQQQIQQQQQQQPRSSKKRPPNISTTLGTSPQQFQQYNQQSAPTNVYPQYGSYSANSSGYHPSALSANDLNARNPDMIGIPPQRINHPVTLGMRRQSVQYGSTPPNYSSSYHNSPSGSGLVPGFGGSRGSSLNPCHGGGSGPSSAGIIAGNSMDFPKASINSQASSSLSTSALSGRALRFQNAAPLAQPIVPLSDQEAVANVEEKKGGVSDKNVDDSKD
ncbi:UNVERIFIED_CONTAM: dual specificity protein kinase yak1 [Siphonaria sp. JEL0065]|nr:dual specificity protein kinase yak1 [Siphonaria sp. JEL0065]